MKKKMSNKKFLAIMIPILAVCTALVIAANVAAGYFAQSLDTYLGKGERVVVKLEGTEKWDTDYYQKACPQALGDDGSLMAAARVTKKITDEGIVLLKNKDNTLPLAKNADVVPFGYRYRDPVYGGTGSGAVDTSKDYVVDSVEGLAKHLNVNAAVSAKLLDQGTTPKAIQIEGGGGEGSGGAFNGADPTIYEFETSVYDGLLNDASNATAIVYIGRISGEGGNLYDREYPDGTRHALALSPTEIATLRLAKETCKNVVVILNTSNIMEIEELMHGELEADAILWIGGPGSMGFSSLGDILVGDVNPSGRTVDIWDNDIKQNPTIINFGDHKYANTDGISLWNGQNGVYFYEYEEGVYYGYRYYETAEVMDDAFVYGELDGNGALVTKGAVNYPFGYGLSYTTFEQKITGFTDSGDSVAVTVEVSNKGTRDGKEVVQLYYTAPYTDLDKELHVEKPVKNLIAFDKVDVKAGQSKTVTLTFAKEEMASYAYRHDNGDGTKGCYFLEEGDYVITLGKNSHDVWETRTTKIASNIWYTNANPRQSEIRAQAQLDDEGNTLDYPAAAAVDKDAKFIAATNLFDEISDYMESDEATILTRADWKSTFPTAPDENKTLDEKYLAKMRGFDYQTDEKLGETATSLVKKTEYPLEKQAGSLTLIDMRGLDYYDARWDELLNQLDYDEALPVIIKAFCTDAAPSVGKPATSDHDGPQGLALTGTGSGFDTCAYCSEPVVAATFNVELAKEYGLAIGEEALNVEIHGWYGPAANLHRSPFNGRNFEYYSEDPVLSGKICANCVEGAESKGLVVYLKHFGWHTYEGVCTSMIAWTTEQAYRETDMKAFEIAVKEPRKVLRYVADEKGTIKTKTMRGISGIMGAATHIGTDWQAASYELITKMTRGEWGFQGVFSTDMGLEAMPGNVDKLLRAGCDVRMHFMPLETAMDFSTPTLTDKTTATYKQAVRHSMHDLCYAYANSNLMQNMAPGSITYYKTSPWKIGLIIGTCVAGAALAALAVWTVVRCVRNGKKKEN
jgi:beta-glucosidase